MAEPGPRSGARDNGLRCSGYVAVGDLDPRIADAMLEALRTEGIAAYVTPTPGTSGGYMEVRLPSQLTDRLFADSDKAVRATELLRAEQAESTPSAPATPPAALPEPSDVDIDSAWQQLLVSLQTPSTTTTPTWPKSEDVPVTTTTFDSSDLGTLPAPGPAWPDPQDEHFVPPPPPPLPKLQRVTIVSLIAILAGILVLVGNVDDGSLAWLAIIAIISGAITLVWHVRQGPPTDSGWDDGAVV